MNEYYNTDYIIVHEIPESLIWVNTLFSECLDVHDLACTMAFIAQCRGSYENQMYSCAIKCIK